MKKITLISAAIFACCILHTACCFSQGTAINSTGAPADNSAMLDVSSNTKGTLITRMTQAERNAIVSPATGLQIFNTTTNCFNFWVGSSWRQICGECDFSSPTAGNNGPLCIGSTLNLSAASIPGATYQWSGPNGFTSSEQNPEIQNVTALSGGSYFVSATLNGCTSPQQSTVVNIIDAPEQPSAITGNAAPCEGSAGNIYSVINESGITYTWTVPTGWNITGGQNTNTINAIAGSNPGDITVTPSNTCGNGTSETLAVSPVVFASGGTVTTSSGYRYHTFTTGGTFTVNGDCSGNVEALVVAGGGGGGHGSGIGGGGGGGGLVYAAAYSVSQGNYTVSIGNGGNGATSDGTGYSGSNSVFDMITAIGGGGGGGGNGAQMNGLSGGCGGGGAEWLGVNGTGGAANQGDSGGGTGYGNNGAGAASPLGGGGGGAGAAGVNTNPPNGGNGLSYFGSYYAGGGGGAAYNAGNIGGNGGSGGGGAGGIDNGATGGSGMRAGANATANTGGGGGGGVLGDGGNGGSGIVIIRYPVP